MPPEPLTEVDRAILDLLFQRGVEKTVCPSEVARKLDPNHWKDRMPEVQGRARLLARRGIVAILQRGRILGVNEPIRGPIRLGHPPAGSRGSR